MNTKKITALSMLLALSLIIFTLEAQLPPLVPIPGIKLGLANIITLVTLVWFGRRDAFVVLVLRIILGSMFSGGASALVYSMSGGLLCFAVMSVLIGILKPKRLWVVSVFGAIAHNVGQIIAAIFVTSTPGIAWYLSILIVSAIITGTFTGLCADAVVKHGSKIFERKKHED